MNFPEALAVILMFIQLHQLEWALGCVGLWWIGFRLENDFQRPDGDR